MSGFSRVKNRRVIGVKKSLGTIAQKIKILA